MDDRIDNSNVCKPLNVKGRKETWSISKPQRRPKNAFRRIRRRRSKSRYYKILKQLRINRKTEDLCSAVEVFDITDMEWAPATSSIELPPEITEWQKQEQIAYWKSRAISLELENRMLHEHLRNVYAKTIEEYSKNNNFSEVETLEGYSKNKSCSELNKTQIGTDVSQHLSKTSKEYSKLSNTDKKVKSCSQHINRPVSPKEPSGKNRLEEMQKIYGDEAQKIMGMETALQLNYEKHLHQLNPLYWPSTPLRIIFE